jgi:alpha-galactosidase
MRAVRVVRASRHRLIPSLVLAAALSACGSSKPAGPSDVDDDFPLPLATGNAPTPPMGWNSWNEFHGGISETLIDSVADAFVSAGLKDAGYTYVNIDDTWSNKAGRASDGSLQADPTKFPDGISAVADHVHAAGLKLGIYGDRGTATCGGYPGSQGYETQDAGSFASWGVDYLKYDNCNATLDVKTQYQAMATALMTTGRPFVFSLCAWQFYQWGVTTGNLWRTTGDISDLWSSIYANLMNNRSYAAYAGPNGWNDPDMLEVGVTDDLVSYAVNHTEYQSHFSLWAIMAAPLIMGNDPTSLTKNPAIQAILTNKEVIALDQDALGLQGTQVWESGDGNLSVWAKPLNAEGTRGVVLLNAGAAPADVSFTLPLIGLAGGSAKVRDLVGPRHPFARHRHPQGGRHRAAAAFGHRRPERPDLDLLRQRSRPGREGHEQRVLGPRRRNDDLADGHHLRQGAGDGRARRGHLPPEQVLQHVHGRRRHRRFDQRPGIGELPGLRRRPERLRQRHADRQPGAEPDGQAHRPRRHRGAASQADGQQRGRRRLLGSRQLG